MKQEVDNKKPEVAQKRLENSKTIENLRTAYMGECQAFTKYHIFSGAAKKDGYEQIAQIFEMTAENERAHAKVWLNYLKGIGSTHDNLVTAAGGEHFEWTDMYAKFAQTALEEGFDELAGKFMLVGRIESQHETAYNQFIKQIEENAVFAKPDKVSWTCRNCGFTVEGKIAPKVCPVCSHVQAFFQVKQ